MTEEFILPKSNGKSIDLVNITKRVAIEADGRFHEEQSFVHRNKFHFFKQLQNDEYKENFCRINNIKLFRITEDDELNEELLIELGIIWEKD